jgi:hypothetical protein
MLICIWYAINFAVSAFFEWKFVNPAPYVLWNGFFLFEALCVFIILIFLWSHLLAYFKPVVQITGHVFGLIFFFLVMGTLSYYFTDYMDGCAAELEGLVHDVEQTEETVRRLPPR